MASVADVTIKMIFDYVDSLEYIDRYENGYIKALDEYVSRDVKGRVPRNSPEYIPLINNCLEYIVDWSGGITKDELITFLVCAKCEKNIDCSTCDKGMDDIDNWL